ncbi:hypothetical protein ACLOJK_004099 [Asimina triloba]
MSEDPISNCIKPGFVNTYAIREEELRVGKQKGRNENVYTIAEKKKSCEWESRREETKLKKKKKKGSLQA